MIKSQERYPNLLTSDNNEYIRTAANGYTENYLRVNPVLLEEFKTDIMEYLSIEGEYDLLDDRFIAEREKAIHTKVGELIGLNEPFQIASGLISPEKPFSNRMIMWNTIKLCDQYIYWIDKYFSDEGTVYTIAPFL